MVTFGKDKELVKRNLDLEPHLDSRDPEAGKPCGRRVGLSEGWTVARL